MKREWESSSPLEVVKGAHSAGYVIAAKCASVYRLEREVVKTTNFNSSSSRAGDYGSQDTWLVDKKFSACCASMAGISSFTFGLFFGSSLAAIASPSLVEADARVQNALKAHQWKTLQTSAGRPRKMLHLAGELKLL